MGRAQLVEERDVGDLVHQAATDGADPGVGLEHEGQVGPGLRYVEALGACPRMRDQHRLVVEDPRPIDPVARVDEGRGVGHGHARCRDDASTTTLEVHRPGPKQLTEVERRDGQAALDHGLGVGLGDGRHPDLLDRPVGQKAHDDVAAVHDHLRTPALAPRDPQCAPLPPAEGLERPVEASSGEGERVRARIGHRSLDAPADQLVVLTRALLLQKGECEEVVLAGCALAEVGLQPLRVERTVPGDGSPDVTGRRPPPGRRHDVVTASSTRRGHGTDQADDVVLDREP